MSKKNCDIVLIFPPIRVWDSPRNFPTGIGLIASRLRSNGYRVGVIDVNGLRLSDQEVLDEIRRCNPRIIGIGGLITTYGWVKRMSRQIRLLRPDSSIILGGSVGASIIETALRNLSIDIIVTGEGEETMLELMAALLNNRQLDGIAGLAYMQDGKLVRTAERPLIENLDDLGYPAWDLFPMSVYLENPVVGIGRDIDIISSRGCPFGCRFCYRLFGKRYRPRSAPHVVGEIEMLKRNYDVDFISFQDDCFVVDKKRVYEICDLMDKKGLSKLMRWGCTGRVSLCDMDMLKRMKASGCVSVSFGIESGSETILKKMEKGVSLEQAQNDIRNIRQIGMKSPVSFMIGYPGENRETVLETVRFCEDLNIPLTALMFTCPYPGTQLYDEVKNNPKFKEPFANEEDFVLAMGDAVDITVNLTEMTNSQLLALRDEALGLAQNNYQPPDKEQLDQQDEKLYGPELYRRTRRQWTGQKMQAHRRRHGFNEQVLKKTTPKNDM